MEELSVDPAAWNWSVPTSPAWVIVLYAPWCGHCQQFVHIWEEFALQTQGATCQTTSTSAQPLHLRVGAVNCVAHEDICSNHHLSSYPTVLLVWKEKNGRLMEVVLKEKTAAKEIIAETTQTLSCTSFDVPPTPIQLQQLQQDSGSINNSSPTTLTTAALMTQANRLRGGSGAGSSSEGSSSEGSEGSEGSGGSRSGSRVSLTHRLDDALRALKFSMLQLYVGRTSMTPIEYQAAIQWVTAVLSASETIFPSSIAQSFNTLLTQLKDHATQPDSSQGGVGGAFNNEKDFHTLLLTTHVLTPQDTRVSLSTTGWKTCRDASDRSSSVGSKTSKTSGSSTSVHKRGFTCGLWTLFHLMVANTKDSTTTVLGIVDFIQHFFQCQECRQHFMQLYGTTAFLNTYNAQESSHGATEWLWRAHNGVNARLRTVEPEHSQWMLPFPSCQQCPHCCAGEGGTRSSRRSRSRSNSNIVVVASSVSSSMQWNANVAVQYVKEFYCVDRLQPDLMCVGNRRDWSVGLEERSVWVFGGSFIVLICFGFVLAQVMKLEVVRHHFLVFQLRVKKKIKIWNTYM